MREASQLNPKKKLSNSIHIQSSLSLKVAGSLLKASSRQATNNQRKKPPITRPNITMQHVSGNPKFKVKSARKSNIMIYYTVYMLFYE